MESKEMEERERERSHTTHRIQRARTFVSLQISVLLWRGRPPCTSIMKSYSQSHCSGYWHIESLCFNMNTIKKKTEFREDSHRFTDFQGGKEEERGTTNVVTKQRGQKFGRNFCIVGCLAEWRASWALTSTQTREYSCPCASPREGDARYMYIVNEGWYLHPILVTFSKALRFILL